MPKKLTDFSLEITAAAIGQYLTEKDKSTLASVSTTTQSLFQPHRLQKMANQLLLQVMRGEQNKAEKILKIHPELLMMTGTATDYSGRKFETTPFRYALWALDTRYMCNMMLDCLPSGDPGEAIKQELLRQFKEQEQNGLDYQFNGMTMHETHYNFSPINAALQTYVNEYDNWDENNNRDAMKHQFSKIIGLAQYYFPAHVAQHYCDPDEDFYPTPKFNKKIFRRSLMSYNYVTDTYEFWFAAVSSTSGLGVDFGICRSRWLRATHYFGTECITAVDARIDLAALNVLCEMRMSELVQLTQRLEGPVQKQDADPEVRQCAIS